MAHSEDQHVINAPFPVRIVLFILMLLVITLSACGPQVVYQEQKSISPEGWAFGAQVCFPFEIKDTLPLYELKLDVTTAEAYKYQNVYVRIHTTFPHQAPTAQVLSLELRDATGLAKGRCSEARCVTTIPLQENVFFSAVGNYSICFEPYMRDTVVTGVESMELRLIRKKEGR